MIHGSRATLGLPYAIAFVISFALLVTGCATAKKGGEALGELVESAVDITTAKVIQIGELTIELIERPIDYVRGSLLYSKSDAAGRTVLHHAVVEKNLEEVERLLDEGAPRKYDNEGLEPYHLAVLQNDPEYLRVFASYHQELDKTTKSGLSPLHLASGVDAIQTFQWLLKAGLDPMLASPEGLDAVRHGIGKNKNAFIPIAANYVDLATHDEAGYSYIHFAALTRNKAAVEQLIDLGVPVDQLNLFGNSALMLAVTQPRSDAIISTLIARGADIAMLDASGDTTLIRSIRANLPQNLGLLIDAGADPNQPDASGKSPIYISLPTNNGDHILQLARAGVDLNQYDDEGFAPIHRATAGNYPRMIDPLVTSGAFVDKPVLDKGTTALMLAARLGHTKIQSNLQRHGASDALRDIAGNTALHYAAGFNRAKSINIAMSGDANINAMNSRGETPIHSAIYRTSSAAFKQLLRKLPDLTLRDLKGNQPLHAALYTGNIIFARELVKQNAPVNSPNAAGVTPLIASIHDNNLDMVDLLINNKNNKASLVLTDKLGRYPLHAAALHNRPEAIIQLARAKSPINPQDANGLTPLHLAAARGHFVAVRALLRNGAFINARGPNLNTPLHLATAADQPNAVHELMRSGADATLRNIDLKAPLFTALDANSLESFAPILRDSNANIRNPMGDTALMVALKQGKFNAGMRLLKLGVSPRHGNYIGETPIQLAHKLHNIELINELARAGADLSTPLAPDGLDLCEAPITQLQASNEVTQPVALALETGSDDIVTDTSAVTGELQPAIEPTNAAAQGQLVETLNDAIPEPGPMDGWRSDCLLYMNDVTYLGKRGRWLMLGKTSNYRASQWWRRIPLPPGKGANTVAVVTRDAQAKLSYYLSYSVPNKYLPPLHPPATPSYTKIERLDNESQSAYLERLDFYTREYQDKYDRKVAEYTQRKTNRLERLAQMKALHKEMDVQPKRPAISFIADALQYHYNRPFRATNAIMDQVSNQFIIEIPVAGGRQNLVLKLSETEYPDHFNYIKREWQRLPWYVGTLVTPDSFIFVELATLAPEGVVFFPLDTEAAGSVKVLVNKFNEF